MFSLVTIKSFQKEREKEREMGKDLVLTPCPGALPHSPDPTKTGITWNSWDMWDGKEAARKKLDYLEFLVG